MSMRQAQQAVGGVNRARRSIVAVAGTHTSQDAADAIAESLGRLKIQTVVLDRQYSARFLAAAVLDNEASSIELCIGATGGVRLLRNLLRELCRMGRGDVSIVIHRTE